MKANIEIDGMDELCTFVTLALPFVEAWASLRRAIEAGDPAKPAAEPPAEPDPSGRVEDPDQLELPLDPPAKAVKRTKRQPRNGGAGHADSEPTQVEAAPINTTALEPIEEVRERLRAKVQERGGEWLLNSLL